MLIYNYVKYQKYWKFSTKNNFDKSFGPDATRLLFRQGYRNQINQENSIE